MAKKTKGDPSGQRTNRTKTARKLKARLRSAFQGILGNLSRLPYKKDVQKVIANKSLTFYQYDVSSEDLETLKLSIQSHLNDELETYMDKMPQDWWYKKEIELPFRQGTLEELNELNHLIEMTAIGSGVVSLPPQPVQPSMILLSPKYLDGLREAQVRNYGLIKSISEDSAKQVYRVLSDGISSGKTVRQIRKDIKDRFKVSVSSAKRIANTEINRAYNDARLETVKTIRAERGIEVAVLHISSLIPGVTRETHADRHGNVYTAEQQQRWWNDGANRINCKCTTRSVLMKKGKVVQSELQKKYKDMRSENG